MAPGAPVRDTLDQRFTNPEPACEHLATNSRSVVKQPDFTDSLIVEFGARISLPYRSSFQAQSDSVLSIFGCSCPFEVDDTVMPFETVDMVDLGLLATEKERLCDQPVNAAHPPPATDGKTDLQISLSVLNRAQNPANACVVGTIDPLNPPPVANLVPALIANDGAPFLRYDTLTLHAEPPFRVPSPGGSHRAGLLQL